MTNDNPERNGAPESSSFDQIVTPLLTGLLYPSESDEPVEPVTCYFDQSEPLTVSQIKDWLMVPPSVLVEERPEGEFWEPVMTEQDWHGDDEKNRTTRFQQVKQVLDNALTGRQVFRVGETEITLYLLGRQATGQRAGVKTTVIET